MTDTMSTQQQAESSSSGGGCPVKHDAPPGVPFQRDLEGSGCPVDHGKVNPDNNMPELTQTPAEGQEEALSTDRVISSIPKTKEEGQSRWEYPSPQQFYNALVRKGWPVPEENVNSMVDIHNFLNEECWNEVLKWEKMHGSSCGDPYLKKFCGRPQDFSPKARILSWFGTPLPFDRHDWTVSRCGKEVRYVIDYYSAPDTSEGDPVFSVDVRPALDSPGALIDRARMAWKEWREGSQQ